MNERIKELMKQSGAYDYYEVNEGVDGDEQPMIKFAELIIQECGKVAYEETVHFLNEVNQRLVEAAKFTENRQNISKEELRQVFKKLITETSITLPMFSAN